MVWRCEQDHLCKSNRISSLPPVDNVYPSNRKRQRCTRMSPADKRYWEEVAGENLRLYRMIQSNSGSRPHHLNGPRVRRSQSSQSLPAIHPTPRSSRPSERKYWSDVSRENRRLLQKILEIQLGHSKRSESSPPIYPAPRRYYPKEVLYWKGVSKENNRLVNKIFRIDKGRRTERKPVIMSARSRSASSQRSCQLGKTSTYFAERGRKCSKLASRDRADTVEVEISFEDQDTGNVIRENVELNLNKMRTRGTMTDYSRRRIESDLKSREEIIADTFIQEKLAVPQVRRTINALATELYRPPWK